MQAVPVLCYASRLRGGSLSCHLVTFPVLQPHHPHLCPVFIWTPLSWGPVISDPSFLPGRAAITFTIHLIQGELLFTQLSAQAGFSCLRTTHSTAPRVRTDMFVGMEYNGAHNGCSLHNYIKGSWKWTKIVLPKGFCYMKNGHSHEWGSRRACIEHKENNSYRA